MQTPRSPCKAVFKNSQKNHNKHQVIKRKARGVQQSFNLWSDDNCPSRGSGWIWWLFTMINAWTLGSPASTPVGIVAGPPPGPSPRTEPKLRNGSSKVDKQWQTLTKLRNTEWKILQVLQVESTTFFKKSLPRLIIPHSGIQAVSARPFGLLLKFKFFSRLNIVLD